ncbi:MAG: DUF4345 family protein [Roseibium sp.]|nr:DUF4345 family protein [Roseibium sp.]
MTRLSAGLGATVFLAYGFGRMISMIFDGAPHDGLVTALAIELVVGSLCLASFWRMSHGRRFRMINAPAA